MANATEKKKSAWTTRGKFTAVMFLSIPGAIMSQGLLIGVIFGLIGAIIWGYVLTFAWWAAKAFFAWLGLQLGWRKDPIPKLDLT